MTVDDLHPDDEALSAHLDGEAPDLAAHVAGCASCAARLEELRRVSVAVGVPVAAGSGARDHAVARALSVGAASPATPRRHRRAMPVVGAVAAAVVGLVTVAALVSALGGGADRHEKAASGSKAKSTRTQTAPLTTTRELGEVRDEQALRKSLQGAAAPAAPAAERQGAGTAAKDGAFSAVQPCLATLPPSVRSVPPTTTATATWKGVPAVVLVFRADSPPRSDVYVLARDDCRILVYERLPG